MTGKTADPRPPSLAGAEWLARPATRAVMSALEKNGAQARVVGGAVRNALLGAPVKDIDIATTAKPDEVLRLAAAAGLKAVPTGLAHGTVTVVAEHVPFEVTTLRRDVETFGRHARVAFTADWALDASRRDFTINALYCDAGGTVHDPLGGYGDIRQRRVRFIGKAEDRIREDYLRILRFFRFTAEYADGTPDPAGLAACVALSAGLDQLSGERVRAEMLRLLAARRAARTTALMTDAGLAAHVLLEPPQLPLFQRVVEIEQALAKPPDPLLRLAALAGAHPGFALKLRQRLKLSNQEYERLARMAMPDRGFDPSAPEHEAKTLLYRHGAEAYSDGAILAWARSDDPPGDARRRHRFALPARWQVPELPIRGSDVIALGVPAGPEVGRVIADFEDWWIGAGFPSVGPQLALALRRLALVTKA